MHGDRSLIAVPLALGAAAAFAVANVTQREAVRHHPSDQAVDAKILLRAVRQPLWLAGLAASIVGFGLEAAALALAPVVLVQPLIVAELPFALPLAAFLARRRLGLREWSGLGLVTTGLAVLVIVMRPTDTSMAARPLVWIALFAIVVSVVALLVGVARRAQGISRTSAVAMAAGTVFGLMVVITKAAAHQFATHGLGALATWQPWALAAVGIGGMVLAQNAFRSGPLAVSLPLIDLGEPLVGSAIAVFAFGERLGHLGFAASAAFLLAVAMVGLGVATLDRSPLVQEAQAAEAGRREPGGTRDTATAEADCALC
jgi:drug/metabolite transporter (DMT)-like permease